MHKQKSLESRDLNYIYENSFVWVNINSIKKKNVGLCKAIQEYYKNKSSLFCYFKGQVRRFVSNSEVEIYIYIDGEGENGNIYENINYTIIEHVRYLLPVDTNFGCSDNTQLIYLNSPNLLENIYQRYNMAYMSEEHRNCIYTYIGYILISVNPYEVFTIYDEEYMRKVKEEENLFNLPHPFSIANDAYHSMLKDDKSQSIIISGESGSGKTESSKQVLNYLTFLSAVHKNEHRSSHSSYNSNRKNQKVITYEEKIQNSNPLLETFGNAKTIKNDNSSRFGKLMRLNYDSRGGLKSASIETYLLAKSRVVDVPDGESNYHIFYSICEDENLRTEYHLLPWHQYNYLIPQKGGIEPEKKKSKNRQNQNKENITKKSYQCLYDLETIKECFNSIGVYELEQREIYKTLICILLLGNIEFVETEKEGEPLQIKNLELCEQISRLLDLQTEKSDTNKIVEILTVKKVREYQKNYTKHQAIYNRDVIAKALYQLIFEYVILRVNDSLNRNEMKHDIGRDLSEELKVEEPVGKEKNKKRKKKKGPTINEKQLYHEIKIDGVGEEYEEEEEGRINNFIGILDIYGFENFSFEGTNGYEQLCINYANEILHSFFLRQIIENEHKIHYEENLNIQKFQYNDNSTVISLIGNTKDISIYTILEDLALLSTSNKSNEKDKNEVFFEKMTKSVINCAKYKSVIRNYKMEKNAFIISHFAGDVLYDTNDFVNKNMDILTSDIENFLLSCNSFISNNLLNKISYEAKKYEVSKEPNTSSLLRVDEPKAGKRKLSVKEMVTRHEVDPKLSGNHMNQIYKNKVKSIFSYFKRQLEILTNKLEKTSSKFIRCIKPNQWKEPKIFDKNLVLNQLVMSGMVDILNLMKNGFPCRIIYEDIWNSYNSLLQEDMREFLTPRMFSELILKFLEIDKNEYRLGKTKVFFRFGVLSIINEVLNKNEQRKDEFLQCVYKYWLDWRKRRMLNFVLFGCRFKILFKKRRAKYLMEIGLEVYNQYWYQKQLQKAEVIAYYYFCVYKSRCYFLKLRSSTLLIQKNIRCYLARKKYLYMKRQILFIQDYYLFHTYFKRRVFSANVIRKNWLTYITRYDYLYVLKCIRIIQREFKKYLKKKYRNYYMNIVQSREGDPKNIKGKLYVKQEMDEEEKKEIFNPPLLRKRSSKYEEDENRMCSFIYIENKKNKGKPRHSFSFGCRANSTITKDTNLMKRRNTWNWSEEKRSYEHNVGQAYRHKTNINEQPKINIIQNYEYNGMQKRLRANPNEEKMFVSVGNTIHDEKNIQKENTQKKRDGRSFLAVPGGANTLKRRTLHDMKTKTGFTNTNANERKKGSRALKNTIYDRYIDKYKQTHNNQQNNKRKRSVYIKNNYSNISNIYNVYKPTKKEIRERQKDQYNFDVIDMLIIPEDFYVCDSYIPEPSIELENNTNYIMLCHYLDNNLNSKIPIIGMDTFKIN